MKLKDKVAFISGSGRGIGKATAILMGKEGAKVVLNDLYKEGINETLGEMERLGIEAIGIEGDVSVETQVNKIVEEVVKKFGQIDILVNNAGLTGTFTLLHEIEEKEWHKIVNNNLKSTFLCCKKALNYMIPNKNGKIINIGSTAGKEGSTGLAPYAASKAGIICLTKTLSWEVARHNIYVNCVVPGLTETHMAAGLDKQKYEHLKSKAALDRSGRPEEVASVVVFLASDNSSFITGQTINVCGGRLSY